jgi:hypothetical protein
MTLKALAVKRTHKVTCDAPFECDFCEKVYRHKSSRVTHIKTKHSEYLLREQSTDRLLSNGMEVLQDVGAVVDMLAVEPEDETTTLEENADTVQMDFDEINQYAIAATAEVIESVLGIIQSEPTIMKNTAQKEIEACLTNRPLVQDIAALLLNGPSPSNPPASPVQEQEQTTLPPTIGPAVPACSGAASFFLLNPEQPIQDLTSSHRSIVLPLLGLDPIPELNETHDDTIEDVVADLNTMYPQLSKLTPTAINCVMC